VTGREVAVIIVTYGRRWHLLQQVVDALERDHPDVRDVIVVDNCSSQDLKTGISRYHRLNIRIVELSENTGSAKGFRVGIETALRQTAAPFLWLLDDDNQPQPQSLKILLQTFSLLGNEPDNVLLSLRKNRREFVNAARHGRRVAIRENSFHGFHWRTLHRKALRYFRQSDDDSSPKGYSFPVTEVGYAPYGGLFMHRCWIEKIGLPDERFFLYADDHEFTSRIVDQGGRIFLCALSEVRDLEDSCHWGQQRSSHLLSSTFNEDQLYLSVRNRVFLETRRFVTCRSIYVLNIFGCLGALFVLEVLSGCNLRELIKRLRTVVRALWAGWRGRLGAAPGWQARHG
jgi:GT2 family glycosyltransferase